MLFGYRLTFHAIHSFYWVNPTDLTDELMGYDGIWFIVMPGSSLNTCLRIIGKKGKVEETLFVPCYCTCIVNIGTTTKFHKFPRYDLHQSFIWLIDEIQSKGENLWLYARLQSVFLVYLRGFIQHSRNDVVDFLHKESTKAQHLSNNWKKSWHISNFKSK